VLNEGDELYFCGAQRRLAVSFFRSGPEVSALDCSCRMKLNTTKASSHVFTRPIYGRLLVDSDVFAVSLPPRFSDWRHCEPIPITYYRYKA